MSTRPPASTPRPDSPTPSAGAKLARAAGERARQRARLRAAYARFGGLTHFDPAEQWAILKFALRWVVLGGLVGMLAGIASAIFLITLNWATAARTATGWLLALLPLAGLALGWLYQRYAGAAARGNNLVVEEVNTNAASIPLRMAPLVLAGTVATHLFGGSAGREGTAIQMGASLADALRCQLRLTGEDRRMMLMAGIGGGFGSVFGTPLAGFVFGLEVQRVGRVRYEGVVPCLAAAIVGDLVTRALGAPHTHYPHLMPADADGLLVLKVAIAGVLFGLTSLLFIELTHAVKNLSRRFIPQAALRPAVGGLVIIALALLFGSDYLGLSLPLIGQSLDGTGVIPFAFLFKLIFTAVTLGSGFLGGEVTPLFVIGSTLGYSLSLLLGVDHGWLAAIGFVAVFAGASNTPLASMLMGVELFGGASALYLAVGCFVAYLASGHRSIYVTQVLDAGKAASLAYTPDSSLETLAAGHVGWLARRFGWSADVAARPVRRIMSAQPFAITPQTPLAEAVEQAVEHGVSALPVVDPRSHVVGILSDQDLRQRAGLPYRLGLLAALSPSDRAALLHGLTQPVGDIMSTPAITIAETVPLADAAALLIEKRLKRLPVVAAGGQLSGLVTRSDLLRELAVDGERLRWRGQPVSGWHTSVSQYLHAPLPSLRRDATLNEAVQLLRESGRQRLLLTDESGRPQAIVTDVDLVRAAPADERLPLVRMLGAPAGSETANTLDVLRRPLYTIPAARLVTVPLTATIGAALRLLLDHQIKRLPVVDADGLAVGWIGRDDALRALVGPPVTGEPTS